MAKEFNITIVIEDETFQEIFENNEVKFSKAKLKRLMEMVEETELDWQERLEELFSEILEEYIQEEWAE